MKQVIQDFGTGELRVDSFPCPALKAGGVLVRTAFSLISAGTERTTVETAKSSLIGKARERPDLVRQVIDTYKREGLRSTYEKVKSRLNQVKPLGYSASGFVMEVGAGADEFKAGDRVACAGGGYASHAEIIFVPKNLCTGVPNGVSLESACYSTLGAIALQGIRQAEIALGETVAVIGLGLVGQLSVQMLKAAGCRVAGIDIDDAVCQLAKASGADLVAADPGSARSACQALSNGRGMDAVLITAASKSNEPLELAGEIARDRAKVVAVGLVGLNVPRSTFYAKELDLRLSRSYGPGRYDPEYEEKGRDYPIGYVRWTEKRNMEAFLALIADGKVNTGILTSHRFPIEEAARAYELISGKSETSKTSEDEGSSDQTTPPKGLRCGVVLTYSCSESKKEIQVKEHAPKPASGSQLGISFIGAGNFARGVLLPIVRREKGIRLLGVATATGISASNTAEQFGFSYSTTDYKKILDDEGADCVFIATRHDSHSGLVAESLRHGKSVFVEKPLAINEAGLIEVVSSAQDTGGLLMAGFNRRFSPLAKELKRAFKERTSPMTIIYRVNAGIMPIGHWTLDPAEGGGRIIGECCHFIDFIQFITDSLPVRVSAAGVPRESGSTDDSAVISIGMADGSVASIIYAAGGNPAAGKEKIEVLCGQAVAVIDDFKDGYIIKGNKTEKFGARGQDKGHAEEIRIFLEAARGDRDRPISLESLAATTLTAIAIARCVRSGAAEAVEISDFISRVT